MGSDGVGAQEGILQRLQSSVEQEETRWREKLEQSQTDLREVGKNKHTTLPFLKPTLLL